MHFTPLPQSFYQPSAQVVAPRLLGHWLIRKTAKGVCGGPIVETEAYLTDDPAAHGFGRETPRSRVMYGPPGRAYIYFIYGNHFCANVVCHRPGVAEAVLIRAVEAEFGEDLMLVNRPVAKAILLTNGPGKLCAAMAIDRRFNEVNLFDGEAALLIACNPHVKKFRQERGPVVTTTRIGLTKAAHLDLRYYLGGSAFISRPAQMLLPQSTASSARPVRASRAR